MKELTQFQIQMSDAIFEKEESRRSLLQDRTKQIMKQLADQDFDPFDPECDIEKRFQKKEEKPKKSGGKKRIYSSILPSPLKTEHLS